MVQRQAERAFLGVPRFAPLEGLQSDLDWLDETKSECVEIWNRLLKLAGDRLTKEAFI